MYKRKVRHYVNKKKRNRMLMNEMKKKNIHHYGKIKNRLKETKKKMCNAITMNEFIKNRGLQESLANLVAEILELKSKYKY